MAVVTGILPPERGGALLIRSIEVNFGYVYVNTEKHLSLETIDKVIKTKAAAYDYCYYFAKTDNIVTNCLNIFNSNGELDDTSIVGTNKRISIKLPKDCTFAGFAIFDEQKQYPNKCIARLSAIIGERDSSSVTYYLPVSQSFLQTLSNKIAKNSKAVGLLWFTSTKNYT